MEGRLISVPCPCTRGVETSLLSCSGPLFPAGPLTQDFSISLTSLPHTNAPATAHMLWLLEADGFHHPTDVISLNGSVCVSRTQPGPTGSLLGQAIFSPVFPSENASRHLLSGCVIPATPSNPYYISPPLTNSLSITPETTCSNILESGKFISELFCLSLLP